MNYLRLITSVILMALLTGAMAADGALPYFDSAEFTPRWYQADSPELQRLHRIPAFSFINQDGRYISEQDVANGVYVANFFFTTCPGICPSIRKKLMRIQEHFREDDYVKILTHTVRPTTDTVDMLHTYATANEIQSDKWHLLTGDKDTIYKLAKDVYFANEDLGGTMSIDDFLHTENLLLIDENRHIRGVYNGLSNSAINNLISDIELLKKESNRRR